jgi:hypothetical protein
MRGEGIWQRPRVSIEKSGWATTCRPRRLKEPFAVKIRDKAKFFPEKNPKNPFRFTSKVGELSNSPQPLHEWVKEVTPIKIAPFSVQVGRMIAQFSVKVIN